MQRALLFLSLLFTIGLFPFPGNGQEGYPKDIIPTSTGDVTLTFIGHGTLMFQHQGKVIHVDPVGREGDYTSLPDADLILVTHEHGDHLDLEAISQIMKTGSGTSIVVSASCEGQINDARVMRNGDEAVVAGYSVEAVPAYNRVHMRSEGQPYHPRGNGNGYIITFGDTRVYVAGDTENIPEMNDLEDIDIAFLPMNLPYTMTPEMVADATRSIRPRILYPYHFGDTDTGELVVLLEGEDWVDVRIREVLR